MLLRIASACPMFWENMIGDSRVRFCAKCQLNVYNLTTMSEIEAKNLVQRNEGRLCVRLYDRGDQTATAQDCSQRRARKKVRRAFVIGALLLVAATSRILGTQLRLDRSALPPIMKQIAEWIDPEPRVLMAAPCLR